MNIRNTLIAVGSTIALSALATSALAAGSVQATAGATLTVLSPTTLTKTQDMAFGTVVRPSGGGNNTIALDANDAVTITGAGNGSLVASTTSSAKFNVISATSPSAPAVTYTTTQTLTFAQTGLLNISAGTPVATSGVLGQIPAGGGTQEIRLGGQFDVTPSTTAQPYTGTLTVTVNYN